MKKRILFGLTLLASTAFGQTIQDARNGAIGQTVTISGVVTNGSELGNIRYMQDGTAGLAAFGSNLSSVMRGDSISATGVLYDFNGLLELSPTTSFVNHGPAVINTTPQVLPITSINESKEAQLVRIENVTFVQTGNFGTGNTTVQVTDGNNTFDVRINGSTVIDGTAIPTGAVTIVGLVGQFNANYQIVPRDLNDIFPYVAPAQDINIKIGGTTILSGETFVVGNVATTAVTIENSGTQNLSVTGATLSGTDAGLFSTNLTTLSIAGGSTGTFNLNYTPTGTGTKTATLSIASNDTDENPYIIQLTAVGTDGVATEPSAAPSALTFNNVKAYTFTGSFTPAANTEKYIVLWKNGAASTDVPVDGMTYKRGDYIGTSKVAYVGPASNFIPRGVIANQNYHVAVFGFNGPAGYENYKVDAPLTGNVTTTGLNIGNYYSGVSTTAPNFVSQLTSVVNPHTVISYANYRTTVMFQFEVKDTTNGQSYVTCAYSGERKVFNDPFEWSPNGYSREHTYSHSWMPTFPADGNPSKPEYSDQHNLYPTNLDKANSIRSNLPLGVVTGNVVFNYLEGTAGYGASGQLVYEPRDSHKGNAARSIMYMAIAYHNIDGNNWQLPSGQNQDILKQWHFADAPDAYEIARQEYIFSQQNNRNPFIDSVDFVCYIDFNTAMNYLADGCTLGTEEQLQNAFVMFPVPAKAVAYLQVNETTITGYQVIDMQGRLVAEKSNMASPVVELNTNSMESGSYLVRVTTPLGQVTRTLVVE